MSPDILQPPQGWYHAWAVTVVEGVEWWGSWVGWRRDKEGPAILKEPIWELLKDGGLLQSCYPPWVKMVHVRRTLSLVRESPKHRCKKWVHRIFVQKYIYTYVFEDASCLHSRLVGCSVLTRVFWALCFGNMGHPKAASNRWQWRGLGNDSARTQYLWL